MTNNWAKWDAEHGSGGGMSSAEKIAASIRGSLGHAGPVEHKTVSSRGRSGSTISRAVDSRSIAGHVQKKDLKRPAPVKGEKDPADAFRTKIRMAEYQRQKKAALGQDPIDKLTLKNEIGANPHHPAGLSAKAKEASKAAEFAPSVDTHHAAAKAHLYAAGAAMASGDKVAAHLHQSEAHGHLQEAALEAKFGESLTPSQFKKLRDSATAATARAVKENSEAAHRDAAEAHARASYAAKALNKPIIAKDHLISAKSHSVQANEIAKNPSLGSTSGKIAALIKGLHVGQKKAHPEPVVVKPGSLEDLANKAEEATAAAHKNPDFNTHKAAAAAHEAARKETQYGSGQHSKAGGYHGMMAEYHNYAATHPTTTIPAEVKVEHKDEHASKFPTSLHGMFTAFMDTVTRRRSQKMYDSVPKASSTDLTGPQKLSIDSYTGSYYSSINNHLRGTHPADSETSKKNIEKHVKNLDDAFEKQPGLKDDLITYRGVRDAKGLFGEVGSKVGSEFQDHGYGSSASHAQVTAGFGAGTGALIRIIHPAGSKLLKPSDIGAFGDGERELLMPRGTRFHVAADRIVVQHDGKQKRMIDLVRK